MPNLAEPEPFDARQFYERYYRVTRVSPAYASFCERAFGRNYAQHGFSDMAQVDFLIEAAGLGPGDRVLEIGCGNGGIAEYISERTGALVTGIDFVPEAILQAEERTRGKEARLAYRVADIAALPFPPGSFDAIISIDTLYFTEMDPTIAALKALLSPARARRRRGLEPGESRPHAEAAGEAIPVRGVSGPRIAAFYSHGANPEIPLEVFPRETLPPHKTPLAQALTHHGLPYRVWDFTQADYRHAALTKRVMEELKPAFEAECNLFLFESRLGEAQGVMAAIEAHAHSRYLYVAHVPALSR